MKIYNIKFDFWKINADPLKEKEINKIIWIIGQSRHVYDISFENFGEMKFDEEVDSNHLFPIVEEHNEFNRRKSNCAIFDIHVQHGTNFYNKLFLYHSNNKRVGNWGYVLLNTETNDTRHTYFINDDLNDIILHINKILNKMTRNESTKFEDLLKKENKSYNINGKTQYLHPITGHLLINDWCRKVFADLPYINVDPEIYRSNKKFIEV